MKISKSIIVATSIAATSMAAAPALAHHSFAMFDTKKDVKIEGTVKEFRWTNPHVWLQIVTKDSQGKEVEMSMEGGSPTGLARQGWSRYAAKPGDNVVVVVHPLKAGGPGGSLVSMVVNGEMVGR